MNDDPFYGFLGSMNMILVLFQYFELKLIFKGSLDGFFFGEYIHY